MDGLDAGVMEAPDVETAEVEVEQAELDGGAQEGANGAQAIDSNDAEGGAQESKDNPFTTQFSRDYRKFLNELKTTNPEAAKYLQQAKNDYGRLFALQQLEPKGIDGIREKYALLDALQHGEAKGPEALAAMQEAIREAEEVDSYILNGDPKAFQSMGPEFDQGLAKLAPAYLERLQQSSPEAFESAVAPHIARTLANTEAVKQYNYLVDIFEGKYGKLDGQTLYARTVECLSKIGESFNEIGKKAETVKTATPTTADPQKSQFENERTQFEQERQTHHWNTKIEPLVDKQRQTLFDQYFKPYQGRLKLNDKGTASVASSFRQGIIEAARNDQAFQRQYRAFKAQKNPDPQAVSNYVNTWMGQKAKNILDGVVNERYGNFLAGKPRTAQTVVKPAGKPQGPAAPNVEVRTVMPDRSEINFQRTPVEWMASSYPGGKKYILNNGKVIQYRPA